MTLVFDTQSTSRSGFSLQHKLLDGPSTLYQIVCGTYLKPSTRYEVLGRTRGARSVLTVKHDILSSAGSALTVKHDILNSARSDPKTEKNLKMA